MYINGGILPGKGYFVMISNKISIYNIYLLVVLLAVAAAAVVVVLSVYIFI